jgi:hypothetical protein
VLYLESVHLSAELLMCLLSYQAMFINSCPPSTLSLNTISPSPSLSFNFCFQPRVQFFSVEDEDDGCLYGEKECIDVGRR